MNPSERFSRYCLELKTLWRNWVSGWPETKVVDLSLYPEATWMDSYEFEQFRKKNPRQ